MSFFNKNTTPIKSDYVLINDRSLSNQSSNIDIKDQYESQQYMVNEAFN